MRSLDDLRRAINAAVEAMDTTPQDYPERAGRLHIVDLWLSTRSDSTDVSLNDLERTGHGDGGTKGS